MNEKTGYSISPALHSDYTGESSRCVIEEFGKLNLLRTSPSPNNNGKRRRRVCFQVDHDDNIETEIYLYQKPARKYYEDMYWTRKEKKMFRYNAENDADDFTIDNPDITDDLEYTFSNCGKEKFLCAVQQQDLETVIEWAKSNGRGVEEHVTDAIAEVRWHAMKQILCCQELLRLDPDCNDADERLRKCSERASAPSREFAFKLALGDAFAVIHR